MNSFGIEIPREKPFKIRSPLRKWKAQMTFFSCFHLKWHFSKLKEMVQIKNKCEKYRTIGNII